MAFDVQAYLRSLTRFGMKPGLERITAILGRLGHPEAAFPAVHIGGTNGKGSTAAMTASMLQAAGYRVGLFTSPHLMTYHERIRVDGGLISDADLQAVMEEVAAAADAVKEELGADPTEFEVGTAAAFLHFCRAGVDVAVVEVGLGGRLDSTNVVHPAAVAVGPISLDHTAVLGPDVASIAREKAGIFKPGAPAVIAPQPPEAARELARIAADRSAPLIWVREAGEEPGDDGNGECPGGLPGGAARYTVLEWGPQGGRFSLETPLRRYADLSTPLLGLHQVQNAAVAVTLVDMLAGRGLAVSEEAVRRGLAESSWPGRFELFTGAPPILLDGVHNPGGARAFARSFGKLFAGTRPVLVVAVTGEKELRDVLAPLLSHASAVVATRPSSSRLAAADPEDLARCARELGVPAGVNPVVAGALDQAVELAGPGGMVCVCGSLYLVGEVRQLLMDRRSASP